MLYTLWCQLHYENMFVQMNEDAFFGTRAFKQNIRKCYRSKVEHTDMRGVRSLEILKFCHYILYNMF